MREQEQQRWLTSRQFWLDTMERVIRTTAQVALAVLGTSVTLTDAPFEGWQHKLLLIGMSAALTFVTCLAGRATGDPATASLTRGVRYGRHSQ